MSRSTKRRAAGSMAKGLTGSVANLTNERGGQVAVVEASGSGGDAQRHLCGVVGQVHGILPPVPTVCELSHIECLLTHIGRYGPAARQSGLYPCQHGATRCTGDESGVRAVGDTGLDREHHYTRHRINRTHEAEAEMAAIAQHQRPIDNGLVDARRRLTRDEHCRVHTLSPSARLGPESQSVPLHASSRTRAHRWAHRAIGPALGPTTAMCSAST